MDILKMNDATATFFVIGSQVAGREELLNDLVNDGNELGNHGTSSRIESSQIGIMLASGIDLSGIHRSMGVLSQGRR